MRNLRLALLLPLLALSLSCHEGDTIVNQTTTDCGLIRSDLLGTWNVSVAPGSTKLFNCSDPAFNNQNVTIPPGTVSSFNDMEIFASSSNVGFFFHDGASPENILGNVETDSCNMLYSFLIPLSGNVPAPLYLQCIGTFDRHARIISASCDSVTVLQAPLTNPVGIQADCDLTLLVQSSITIQ